MFRLWGKMVKDNRLIRDMVVELPGEDTRTHKVFAAVDQICNAFDLERPIWLQSNVTDFQRHKKTRFREDSFIEKPEFDYLEILVIEED